MPNNVLASNSRWASYFRLSILTFLAALVVRAEIVSGQPLGAVAEEAAVALEGIDLLAARNPDLIQKIAGIGIEGNATLADRIGFGGPEGDGVGFRASGAAGIWSSEYARRFVESMRQKAKFDPQLRKVVDELNAKAQLPRPLLIANEKFDYDQAVTEVSRYVESLKSISGSGSADATATSYVGPWRPALYAEPIRATIEDSFKKGKISNAVREALLGAVEVNLAELTSDSRGLWGNWTGSWIAEKANSRRETLLLDWARWTIFATDLRNSRGQGKLTDAAFQQLREALKAHLAEIQANGSGIWSEEVRSGILDNANAGEESVLVTFAEVTIAARNLRNVKDPNASTAAATALVSSLAKNLHVSFREASTNADLLYSECRWFNAPIQGSFARSALMP
jgi:hypothetical protein